MNFKTRALFVLWFEFGRHRNAWWWALTRPVRCGVPGTVRAFASVGELLGTAIGALLGLAVGIAIAPIRIMAAPAVAVVSAAWYPLRRPTAVDKLMRTCGDKWRSRAGDPGEGRVVFRPEEGDG
jgi:hypothetical protein